MAIAEFSLALAAMADAALGQAQLVHSSEELKGYRRETLADCTAVVNACTELANEAKAIGEKVTPAIRRVRLRSKTLALEASMCMH